MSYRSEAVKRWRRNTKARIVESMGGCCQICGYSKCHEAMDLHHIDPKEKELSFGALRASPRNWNSVIVELRKCILLCNRCHQEFHAGIVELPETFERFNEDFCDYRKKVDRFDSCPVCGGNKLMNHKTCSFKCSNDKRKKVDWSSIDLIEMKRIHGTYSGIGEILGVSDNTVRKHYARCKST